MYFNRNIEKNIIKQLDSVGNEIILLSGARQTGKSTLIENLIVDKPKLIINFWDESPEINALKHAATFELFTKYLFQFFKFTPDGKQLLVIDEAQASPTLGSFIMQIHREWKAQKVILLGSILSNLFSQNIPMPMGRVVDFVCRPLTFGEFLRFRKKESYVEFVEIDNLINFDIDDSIHSILMGEYELFMQYGGLPGIINALNDNLDVNLLFESLLNNLYRDADRFIGSDIGARGRSVQYGSLVEHILKSVGQLVAFPSTNSSILSSDSPAYRTILPTVIEALKAWHLIYVVSNETNQQTTKKGYSSKKYLYDTGLMNYLVNHLMPTSLNSSSVFGSQSLENSVMQCLVSDTGSVRNIFSYKTNNKITTELDFVAKFNDRFMPIEVKSSSKVNQKSLSQVIRFLDAKKQKTGVVIYTGKPQRKNINNFDILFLPPYYLPIIQNLK